MGHTSDTLVHWTGRAEKRKQREEFTTEAAEESGRERRNGRQQGVSEAGQTKESWHKSQRYIGLGRW